MKNSFIFTHTFTVNIKRTLNFCSRSHRKLTVAKISVFQGNFIDGETEYFQVSKYSGGPLFLVRLLDPALLYSVLILQDDPPTCFVPRNPIDYYNCEIV